MTETAGNNRDGAESTPLSADDVIRLLALAPHPEGGFFRETFRDTAAAAGGGGRAASTAICYLLRGGETSRWHRVDAAEVWHWYAGAPLRLMFAPPDGPARHILLGNALAEGHVPQAAVPASWWQAAESLGAWTLAGCTVAPGFTFSGFELAPEGFAPR